MWRTPNLPDGQPDTAAVRAARAARRVTVAATVLFTLVLCRWRPWNLFARAGFSSDFYDEQARAMLHGHLAVNPAVAGIEGFLINGRTYLYYGPFLAVARLPVAVVNLIAGNALAGRITRLSMVVGFVVFCTGAHALAVAARRWWQRPASSWRTAGFVAAAACSPVLYLAGWASVYHETELWAAAFAVWAAVGAIRFANEPARRPAVLAAVCTAAAITTRATVGLGIAAGVGSVALWCALRKHGDRRDAVTIIAGCVAGAAVHMSVNLARFGSLLGLPVERQVLTLNNPARAAWFAGNNESFFSLRFLPTTVVHYLRPDAIGFERLAPVVRFGPLATNRGSYPLETITPSASLITTATVLLVAAAAGAVVLVVRREATWLLLLAGAALATVPTFAIGFIANRYLVDMLPMLMIPAAVAFIRLSPPRGVGWHRATRVVFGMGVLWGAFSNVALATWTQNLKEPGFTAWRYQLDAHLFAAPSPGIVDAVAGAEVPQRDGTVGLSADGDRCVAVYVAEQGRWVPLERANNARRLTGTFTPTTGSTVLVAGTDTFSLNATATADTLQFSTSSTSGEVSPLDSAPLPWNGEAVAITVVADPVLPELSVTVAGRSALFSFRVPTGTLTPGTDFTVDPTDQNETLCRQLAHRR
ncbi:MAG: hypothetical protein WCO88_06015 [Actinomycetota bacterium]